MMHKMKEGTIEKLFNSTVRSRPSIHHLNVAFDSFAFHPRSHVDGVTPDVIQRFVSAYDTSNNGTDVETWKKRVGALSIGPYIFSLSTKVSLFFSLLELKICHLLFSHKTFFIFF